jgi:catechol 2,3-dioxygenase-like lactoylglutathione lyase family enzyme
MVGYVTLGTNDIERAARFYDALLAVVGGKRFMDMGTFIGWTRTPDAPAGALCLTKPYDGKPATVGNGVMVALAADTRQQVDALHAKAIELGATDEGAPGPRGDGFYAGYFRDLDGNKLNAFFMG